VNSFRRIISQLARKLPRVEDQELLIKLADEYEQGGSEAVQTWLEYTIESIESE